MAIVGLTDTGAVRLTRIDKWEQCTECAKRDYHRVGTARETTAPEAMMAPLIEMFEGSLERWKPTSEAVVALPRERDAIGDKPETDGVGRMDRIESVISERVPIGEKSESGGMGSGAAGREDEATMVDRTRESFRTTRDLGDE